jgi:uncharacterized membrane-anchored protein YjiN (DUF445 family)
MSSMPLREACKLYLEFSSYNLESMVEQMLKSPELISSVNTLTIEDKTQLRQKIKEEIIRKILDRETEYYLEKYEVRTTEEFVSLFEDKLLSDDLKKIRLKIAKQVIDELAKK